MGEGWEQQREELVARLPDEPFDPHTPNPSPVQETAREMQRTWEREVKDWLSTPPGLCAKCNGMGEVMHEGFGYYRPIGGMSTGNRSERVTCPTCDGKKYPPFLLGDDQ